MSRYVSQGASCHEIAWVMFITDPRVRAFVKGIDERPEKRLRVLTIAWERDEQGWRTELIKRAFQMAHVDIDHADSAWAMPGVNEVCRCPVIPESLGTGRIRTKRSATCRFPHYLYG